MTVKAGDVVRHTSKNGEQSDERVVVDVTEDEATESPRAVLRTVQDVDLLHPYAVPVSELEIVGHLGETTEAPEGWTEDERGVWKQV